MILLYHLVFPDSTPKDTWNAGKVLRLSDFKQQLVWLKKRFEIVSLQSYMAGYHKNGKPIKGTYAITFDDGYRQVFDLVAPFLIKEEIPATFFISTGHLGSRELLWFVYFNALCSEKCYDTIAVKGQNYSLTTRKTSMAAWRELISAARESGDAIAFYKDFLEKYPLPEHVIAKYDGLSEKQIVKIGQDEHLSVGAHTIHHPYLDQISKETQSMEIIGNKQTLEKIIGKEVQYFAFTGGLYNKEVLISVKEAGFEAAFAITPRHIGSDPIFEMSRTDIYSPSLLKFKLKVFGLVGLVRSISEHVG